MMGTYVPTAGPACIINLSGGKKPSLELEFDDDRSINPHSSGHLHDNASLVLLTSDDSIRLTGCVGSAQALKLEVPSFILRNPECPENRTLLPLGPISTCVWPVA
jgi:hypothetical protein